jgi:rfaE bifunctional protein nucleotidyltransferase chain/domain/rfaE bifunctional protein kinase chain/domain
MRIAVVGDVLLDVDMHGSVDRLSPDAPVPVVAIKHSIARAGGAGLVATMLARDGVDVVLVTALSSDARADDIRQCLERSAAGPGSGRIEVVAGDSLAPTPVKTRVRGAGQAVVRIDEGCEPPGPPQVTALMIESLENVDAVVVADYGRGIAADEALRQALRRAGERVPLVWDPHPRGADPVDTAALVTPNAAEAAAASGGASSAGAADGVAAAEHSAATLASRWGCPAVLVTLGHRGALLHVRRTPGDAAAPLVVPAAPVHGVDPCGAGDRLASAAAVSLARGRSLAEAARDAVEKAGLFLAAGGVAGMERPANTRTLVGEAQDALAVAHRTRSHGGTVVATGGCFDLMHAGHARTLAAARALGDCLIVCLNSDDSVRRLKGPERPIMSQHDRVDLLLALECVDAVVVFDEDTPENVLRRLEPDIWVKGGDYRADELPETAVLAGWGGRTITVPYYAGRSSTRLAGALARVG